jgi:hypothetical protein
MASFAKIGLNGRVIEIVSVSNEVLKDSNGIEKEDLGIDFLTKLTGWAIWKQTSYNTVGGIHLLNGTPFRKNHAGIGYTYDEERDAFIPKKPYNSWIFNEQSCGWEAPVERPTDKEHPYIWDESTQSWAIPTQ